MAVEAPRHGAAVRQLEGACGVGRRQHVELPRRESDDRARRVDEVASIAETFRRKATNRV